jgi:hypothetical protein
MMISAYIPESAETGESHDAYLMKPVRLDRLLDSLRKLLDLEWIHQPRTDLQNFPDLMAGDSLSPEHLAALQKLGQIGHLRGILSKLDEISAPQTAPALAVLRQLTLDCDMVGFQAALKRLAAHDR